MLSTRYQPRPDAGQSTIDGGYSDRTVKQKCNGTRRCDMELVL